ncbi:MAG: helix-turn-helix transcriptional regulator [Bacteroidales bacterium]|nr:helix-turn-helix transcriptional regulator [Bacteroidales bacterium]
MTDIDLLLNQYNPKMLAARIAENFKKTRISHNFTQEELSQRSGVALSSLKRFEQKAEISLASLLKLAVVLESSASFEKLFAETKFTTLDSYVDENKVASRKRVRKK